MSKQYSSRPVGWASVSDPAINLVGFKLEAVYSSDSENQEVTNCPICSVEISFDPSTTQNPIEQVACTLHKFQLEGLINWANVGPAPIRTKYKSDKPELCPGCGGERKGRGYSHKNDECNYKFVSVEENIENSDEINTDTVSINITQSNVTSATENINKIIKDVCPECKGIPKGRGFAHADNCSLSTKAKLAAIASQRVESSDTCPICKGLKAGRGYSHADDCTESTKYKLNQQKELRQKAISAIGEKPLVCPECNGSRKGRGYAHSDNCSLRTGQAAVK